MTRALVGRRSAMAAVVLVVAALGGASVAWACSQQARASVAGGQTSGPAGSKITVSINDFGPGPVQVRWNSKGGQPLGEGQGPSFSVPVTIPQAPAGVHYIVAFETVGTATASVAFEVTAPSRTNTNTATNTSGATSTSASGADEETTNSSSTNSSSNEATNTSANSGATASQTSTDSGATSTAQASEPTNTATASSSSEQASAPAATSAAPGTSASSGTAASAPVASAPPAPQARPASANPPVVTTSGGQAVFGGSSATPVAPVETDKASAATVSGDTWSGFASGAKPSLMGDIASTPASAGGSGSGLGLGVGLLGAGVVALFAGFAAAESSRKRALAGAERG